MSEESLCHRLVTLQELANECFAVFVGTIFGLNEEVTATAIGLDIHPTLTTIIVQSASLHRQSAQLFGLKQRTMPGKACSRLQTQVGHCVAEAIGCMLAAPRHLLLSGSEEVDHRRVVRVLRIDGQRLDEHRHCTDQSFVGSSVVDGTEQHLLLIVELGQQVGVNGGEERTLEDAVFHAKGFYPLLCHRQLPGEQSFLRLRFFPVGQQRSIAVAAVEMLCIPLFVGEEGVGLPDCLFMDSHITQSHLFGLQCLAAIGPLDVLQQHSARGTVADDMVNVLQQIVVGIVFQKAQPKESVVQQVEGLHEGGGIAHCSMFHLQIEGLRVVNGLHGFAVGCQFDTGEQCQVGSHGRQHRLAEPFFVQSTVEGVAVRDIIANLSLMCHTLHIETILRFC